VAVSGGASDTCRRRSDSSALWRPSGLIHNIHNINNINHTSNTQPSIHVRFRRRQRHLAPPATTPASHHWIAVPSSGHSFVNINNINNNNNIINTNLARIEVVGGRRQRHLAPPSGTAAPSSGN